MSEFIDALATEGAKELVQVLAAGFLGMFKKIPALWRHAGNGTDERMAAELERTAAELSAASGGNTGKFIARAEIIWETRLRDLLIAYPEARQELQDVLAEIRREKLPAVVTVQNVTALGQSSVAQGVIGGSLNNYGATGLPQATDPSRADDHTGGGAAEGECQ
jgi:hypothetical protein